jgi:hypothetical protein
MNCTGEEPKEWALENDLFSGTVAGEKDDKDELAPDLLGKDDDSDAESEVSGQFAWAFLQNCASKRFIRLLFRPHFQLH